MGNQTEVDQLFVKKPGSDGDCYRCGNTLRTLTATVKEGRQFKKLTGRPFPRPGISLNVAEDSKALGAAVPAKGRGMFCCGCAVAYMMEFNRLNSAMRAN